MGKLLAAMLVVIWVVQPSFAGSYFVFEDRGGTWHDADKSCPRADDGLMCWAAAAANVLKWGRWDTKDHDSEASIFSCFHDHWTNGTGSPAVAWQWWLNGRRAGSPGTGGPAAHGSNDDLSCDFGKLGAHPKSAGSGGRYWPSFGFRSYFHEEFDPSKSMDAIDDFLHKGYGVVMGVERKDKPTGHVVTVWGRRTDERGRFEGVYVTNSDDGARRLDYFPIIWDGRAKRWDVPLLDGFIKEVWALEPRPDVAS